MSIMTYSTLSFSLKLSFLKYEENVKLSLFLLKIHITSIKGYSVFSAIWSEKDTILNCFSDIKHRFIDYPVFNSLFSIDTTAKTSYHFVSDLDPSMYNYSFVLNSLISTNWSSFRSGKYDCIGFYSSVDTDKTYEKGEGGFSLGVWTVDNSGLSWIIVEGPIGW